MIFKTISTTIYFLSLCLIFATTNIINPMYWSELPIANQIHIIIGVIFMITIATIATVIFKSVWIRKGYEGVDHVLEGTEVALMLSHVIAFCLVEGFFFLLIFGPYIPEGYPQYVYWICAAGFIEPGVFLIISNLGKRKKEEGHE